jgi:hypothetical protein
MASVPAIVIVPELVTGPPLKVSPVIPPETSMLVTVPPVPVAAIVMLPVAFVTVTPDPAVKDARV